ncbi:ferredoxin-thioredoxin reductase catalytic domain-containing protein [Oceanispirochaeta sp.]|jgi:ferredoxin-thioredoxin reductase catalytic chain|uniref:ferredoxin-thioredoxin reductase catalytic domain-containing protein n=1 Tax=Oceanispirochaeta sp. TaxID=2035350 RepID=UPI002638457B|nr:ferredoxin-thioredoxin reductase catalytic domain-containing protein [Oceanispirochaeta sp.]MDA3957385.1 ferredoxin:thioredoxin reductase [Oceanispirochaeta sp.]
MAEKNIVQVKMFLKALCEKQNLILNNDEDHVNSIAEGLMEMYNSLGYYCCPCREAWGDRKNDRDIICPCDYCKPDVAEFGQCYCGLFVSEDSQGKELGSIPDRRDDALCP